MMTAIVARVKPVPPDEVASARSGGRRPPCDAGPKNGRQAFVIKNSFDPRPLVVYGPKGLAFPETGRSFLCCSPGAGQILDFQWHFSPVTSGEA
jgi:hypothetical protein